MPLLTCHIIPISATRLICCTDDIQQQHQQQPAETAEVKTIDDKEQWTDCDTGMCFLECFIPILGLVAVVLSYF